MTWAYDQFAATVAELVTQAKFVGEEEISQWGERLVDAAVAVIDPPVPFSPAERRWLGLTLIGAVISASLAATARSQRIVRDMLQQTADTITAGLEEFGLELPEELK